METRQKQHQLTQYRALERDLQKQLNAVRVIIENLESFPDELLSGFDSLAEPEKPLSEKTLKKVAKLREQEYSPAWSMTEKIWWLTGKYGEKFITELADLYMEHEPDAPRYQGDGGIEALKRDLNFALSKLKRENKIRCIKEPGLKMKWGV